MTALEGVAPMLAKAVAAVPEADSVEGGLSYEPKWDGFRAIVHRGAGTSPDAVEIGSRGSKPLTRYFPELVEEFLAQLPEGCVVDGEIVVRTPTGTGEKLDWEALSQRIHPAAFRVAKLAEETPASFVAFDLLALDGEPLLDEPFSVRRAALEKLMAATRAPLHLTRTTTDAGVARRWLEEFEGAGLDGVVAKPLAAAYAPNKRVMLKAKHHREADVVVTGYRIHKSGSGVGSLLLGLYDDAGELRGVGGASAFSDVRRQELIDELAPHVLRDEHGDAVTGDGEKNRFNSAKDTSFVKLDASLVVQVRYDQMEGDRFRHTVQVERWRTDRDARSCTFEQLEIPADYDLSDVLA